MINWPKLILKFIKMLLPSMGKSLKGIWSRTKKGIIGGLKGILSKLLGCNKKNKNNPISSTHTSHPTHPVTPPFRKTNLIDFVNYNAEKGFLTGIDIHDTNTEINWDEVKNSGVSFALIKATEGAHYRAHNNHAVFIDQWNAASDHNIVRGAYFYYVTDYEIDTPQNQAENFINQVLTVSKPTDLPPAIDIENIDFNNLSLEQLQDDLLIWLKLVETAFGKRPILYSNRDYYKNILNTSKLRDYKVWIADPSTTIDATITKWTFWQNKMNIVVPSITGEIDLNRFKGSLTDLKEL